LTAEKIRVSDHWEPSPALALVGLTWGRCSSLIRVYGLAADNLLSHRSSLPTGSLLPRTPKHQTCFGDYAAAAAVILALPRVSSSTHDGDGFAIYPLEPVPNRCYTVLTGSSPPPDELTIRSGFLQEAPRRQFLFLAPIYCGVITQQVSKRSHLLYNTG